MHGSRVSAASLPKIFAGLGGFSQQLGGWATAHRGWRIAGESPHHVGIVLDSSLLIMIQVMLWFRL